MRKVSDTLFSLRFGFYKYMKMDKEEGEEDEEEEVQRRAFLFLNPDGECLTPALPAQMPDTFAYQTLSADFLDDEDEQELLDSLEPTDASLQQSHRTPTPAASPETTASPTPPTTSPLDEQTLRHSRALNWAPRPLPLFLGRAPPPRTAEKSSSKVYVTRVRPGQRASPRALRDSPWPPFPGVFLRPKPLPRVQLRVPPHPPRTQGYRTSSPKVTELRPPVRAQTNQGGQEGQLHGQGLMVPTVDLNSSVETQSVTSFLSLSQVSRPQLPGEGEEGEDGAPGDEATSEDSEEEEEQAAGRPLGRWREDAIDWQRTFSVGAMDFELLRSDWNDLRCNVSGNLQLPETEAVDVVAQYMERLNARHGGYGTGGYLKRRHAGVCRDFRTSLARSSSLIPFLLSVTCVLLIQVEGLSGAPLKTDFSPHCQFPHLSP